MRRGKAGGTGRSPVVVGAIVLVLVVIVTFLGFTKHIPFTHGFRLKAVVESANSIRLNSPVRIAGVNIGKVTDIQRQPHSNAAVISMEIQDAGLPIHKDATLKIRPRIFLEGNFFIDLFPGSPSAPKLSDSDTIPITQTAKPVQLDEVLSALQSDTRKNLQDFLEAFGQSLNQKPTRAEDLGQDPQVQGLTGAEAVNKSYDYAGPALRNASIVNQALLGTQPHDLSKLIGSLNKVTTALDDHEGQLQDLITNFNTTVGATAAESTNLQSTIHLLAPTLVVADSALKHLNQSLPPTRAFAREILPGVRETPATINASFPWIKQTRGLLGPKELRGVVRQLSPATAQLAELTDRTIQLLPQVDLVNKCFSDVILPTGDVKIADGPLSNNVENYKEFWYTMVGLAGEGQNFDGNGMYVHFQPGGGTNTVSTGKSNFGGDQLFANDPARPLGTRPRYPGKRPPYNPDFPCYKNTPPDLNGPAADIGPVEQASGTPSAPAALASRAAKPTAAPKRGGSVAQDLANTLNPFSSRWSESK